MVKVLIIEDEPIIRKTLMNTIDWKGVGCCIVGEAENGIEGLERIRDLKPDLLLVDIHLPKLDGISMLEQIDPTYSYEAIIITGYSEFDYARKAVKLKVIDYVLKPINQDKLLASVNEAVSTIRKKREVDNIILKQEVLSTSFNSYLLSTKNYRVKKTLEFIANHYSEPISITTASNMFRVSASYLSRLLRKCTGHTFHGLLNMCRIQNAINIMEKSETIPLSNISDQVGYSDYKYFSEMFKKTIGITPSLYINEIKQKTFKEIK